jgi:polysaccharide biosynthesis/export protein
MYILRNESVVASFCVLDSSKMRAVSKFVDCHRRGLVLVAAVTASAFGQIAVPVTVASNSTATSSSTPSPAPSRIRGDSAVRLGAGDLIDVSVYNVPELETKIRVNSEGNISLPLINDVHVDGLTIDEAEAAIERRFDSGGFVKNPHVQIFVQEYTSQGASVLGEVAKPGNYPILGDQKLFSLISAAGGFTDRAGKSITVTHRGQAPVAVPISRNLEDNPGSDIAVFPGDTVIVRRADVVYVVGDVSRPSGFMMDSGHISVLQAIALAGGTNSTAKMSGARIIRKGPMGLQSIPVPLKKLMLAKTDDMPMEADDILFVPTSSRKQMEARSAEAAAQLATAVGIVAVHP